MVRRLLIALSALLSLSGALMGAQFSGATWTHSSTYGADITAGDWTPPTISLGGVPASTTTGTSITVTASVVDSRSPIVAGSVRIEYAVAGSSTWSALSGCSSTPTGTNQLTYSCNWNVGLTSGSSTDYQVHALAADTAGNAGTSSNKTMTVTTADSGVVVLDPLPDAVRGTVTLTDTLYTTSGANTFLDLSVRAVGDATFTTPPGCGQQKLTVFTCTWNTTGLNGYYEVQAHGKVQGTDSYDSQTVLVDNTAPVVAISAPSVVLADNVVLSATASDLPAATPSGIASVTFQYRKTGGSWANCRTDKTPPYSCSLDTTALANASYDFQAIATDNADNTTTSASITRTVDNTPAAVSIASPADGTVLDMSATITVNASSPRGITQVKVQARPDGGSFSDVCVDTTSPYSCAWDTSTLPSTSYDLRAVLSQSSGGDVTSSPVSVGVDHNPGTVSVASPGAVINRQNAVIVTGTTTSPSGVASVVLKATPVSPAGSTTSTPCTLGGGTFSCTWDTSAVVYGSYELRAQMKQGNKVTVTSNPVSVSVDNMARTVSLALTPAASNGYVRGTETLTATTDTGIGVASVRYDVSPTKAGSWSPLCAPIANAPYTCSWNTLTAANAAYDLRAVMTLVNGTTIISDAVSATVVNLGAKDVQAGNGNGTLAAGDSLTLTYSAQVNLATIKPGWGGAATPVAMSFKDAAVGGAGSGKDRIDFSDTNLGQVTFGQDYVSAGAALTLSGTMTAALVNGVTVVTVAVTSVTGTPKPAAVAGTMTWTPSAAVTDAFLGGGCLTTAVTESGAADADF